MVKATRLAFVCLGLLALFAPLRAAALEGSTQESEQRFLTLANGERSQRGLPELVVAADLVDVARRQAARMAAEHRLYHNPNLQQEVQGWEAVGENVGTGMDTDQVHVAFMGSRTHRDNILSPAFSEVGMGVAPADDGGLWVAQVFRRPETVPQPAPAPSASADEPVVRAASAAHTTATVAPPSTTTTTAPPAPPPPVTAPPVTAPASVAEPAPAAPAEVAAAPLPPNPGRVRLGSAQRVSFTTDPEVSTAVAAAAALLVLVVAGQTAALRRLRLI